jgi:hypothetical protein
MTVVENKQVLPFDSGARSWGHHEMAERPERRTASGVAGVLFQNGKKV